MLLHAAGRRPLLDQPWVVLGLLFLAMGVLGLPLLWTTRAFAPGTKLVLAIVVTIYTALLVWGTGLVLQWSYTRIMDAYRGGMLLFN